MKSFTVNALKKQYGNCHFIVRGVINGKRKRAFFKTKELAERAARKWNEELVREGHRHADIPSALRAVAITQQERLERAAAAHPDVIGVFTLERAVDELLAKFDLRTKSIPVAQAWAQFQVHLEDKVATRQARPDSRDGYKRIERFVTEFAGEQLCDLTTVRIQQWLETVRQQNGEPYSIVSKENLRIHISGFFTFCLKRKWIQAHPVIGQIEVFEAEEHRPEILVAQQAARLLEVADTEILPAIAIGLFAGIRPAEVRRLNWSDILWHKNEIDVQALNSKTGSYRFVPMPANLVEWLAPYRTATGKIFTKSKSTLEKRISAAGRAAGIATWPKDGLRHSYGSHHYAAHKNAPLTAACMGHETTGMLFDHYNNRRSQDEGVAYFQIRPLGEDKVAVIATPVTERPKQLLAAA